MMSRAAIAASTLVALVFLGGCSEGSPVALQAPSSVLSTLRTPPILPGAQHYGNDIMYSAQLYGNDLSVYRRRGFTLTHEKTLTDGISAPNGMVTTVNGWWYVTNGGHSNVLIYQTKLHGPVGPVDTLDDYGWVPVNVGVTPDRNVVAVSNSSTVDGSAGSVNIYLKRQAEPSRTLGFGRDNIRGEGVAIDHRHNCYWAFNDPNTQSGSVVEFVKCTGKGKAVVSGIPNVGGIIFDQSDDLFYVNQTAGGSQPSGVYKCTKTSGCALAYGNFGQPVNINFDYQEKSLWVADASGYIDAIDLKTNKVYQFPSVDGDPYGIAPEPGD